MVAERLQRTHRCCGIGIAETVHLASEALDRSRNGEETVDNICWLQVAVSFIWGDQRIVDCGGELVLWGSFCRHDILRYASRSLRAIGRTRRDGGPTAMQ